MTHVNFSRLFPACNCNGRSNRCYFDQELWQRTGHGGHCLDCIGNTDGANCERCKENFYQTIEGRCVACNCDPIGQLCCGFCPEFDLLLLNQDRFHYNAMPRASVSVNPESRDRHAINVLLITTTSRPKDASKWFHSEQHTVSGQIREGKLTNYFLLFSPSGESDPVVVTLPDPGTTHHPVMHTLVSVDAKLTLKARNVTDASWGSSTWGPTTSLAACPASVMVMRVFVIQPVDSRNTRSKAHSPDQMIDGELVWKTDRRYNCSTTLWLKTSESELLESMRYTSWLLMSFSEIRRRRTISISVSHYESEKLLHKRSGMTWYWKEQAKPWL